MFLSDFRFGFRILGSPYEDRRLVDHAAAFAAYASCDPKAEVGRETYLSAFCFAEDFRRHLVETGSTAGFAGPCWSPWLWFDIDAEDLGFAYKDAGALAVALVERYGAQSGDLLLFFSGSKGFHVGLPTALWSPVPSDTFHRTARRFAEHVAELAAVTIDTGIYDRVRPRRAPNSRHPKTGLHKRRLTLDELTGLPLDELLALAREPAPFTLPAVTGTSDQAAADWQAAAALVASEGETKAARRAAGNGSPTLNRSTLDFIREGAHQGDRHRLLFSAAANLREFGCPPALAFTLLEESALDAGLPPKEVRRQIECGLAAVPHPDPLPKSEGVNPAHQDPPESTQEGLDGSTEVEKPPERNTSDSGSSEGQSCQQVTGATRPEGTRTPAADLRAALAKLWTLTPATSTEPAGASPAKATPAPAVVADQAKGPPLLPPDPPPLKPLPPGAVETGRLETPCKCGSRDYVDVAISGGRTRRDCRNCGRFVGWGKWYDQGGAP